MTAPAAIQTPAQPRRAPAVLLGSATFLFWISQYLYVPSLPGYARGLGATATWIGLITGTYGLAQLLLRIPVGIWSDRLGQRKPFVLAGCGFAMLSGLAFAAAGGPIGLLGARALSGMAATMWVAFTVLYTAYFPGRTAAATAVVAFMSNAGIITGQVVGPLVVARTGEQAVFLLSAAVGGAAIVLAALAPDVRLPARGTPGLRNLLGVASNRVVLTVSLLAAVAQYLTHGGVFVFINDWAQQRLGATVADLSTLSLYTGIPTAVATLAGGTWLARRLGNRTVVLTGFLLSAVTMAAVPLVPHLGALYWTQAAGGLARGLTTPLLMGMALSAVPPERSATAAGFFQATYSLGMTAGPLLTGVIADTAGPAGGFWVMSALALAGVAATYVALPAAAPAGAGR